MSLETNPALRRSVIYELYVRSHTPQGTFRAVEPDLPRIRAQGPAILSLLRSTDVVRLGPGLSAPDFAEYGIRTIPIRNCQVQINVGWIQRSREMLSTEAQAFVKMLEELYPKNEK